MCDHCKMLEAAEEDAGQAYAEQPRSETAIAEAMDWLDRVKRAKCECAHGVYYGRGYVENGVFKGQTGTCFRCGGKGYQTNRDRKRNRYYDSHVRRVYA